MTKTGRHDMVTNNNAVDVHVGKRICQQRVLLGMSQERLGNEMNITFQQVQKYEKGGNRVSASRLWDISQILGVDIGYFFEEMSTQTKARSPRQASGSEGGSVDELAVEKTPLERRETLELVRVYYAIENVETRNRITALIRSIAHTKEKNDEQTD